MKFSTSTCLWCFAGCVMVFIFLYVSLFLMFNYRLSLGQIDTKYGAYHIQQQGLGCGSACYSVVFCELLSCDWIGEYVVIDGLKSINNIYIDEFDQLVVVPQGIKIPKEESRESEKDYRIVFE